MAVGKMKAFAQIISRTIATDSEGFKTETDTVIASVRCYHEGRHGSRRWANLAAFSEATDLFVIRAQGVSVVPGYFIDCGGVRYKITSVENVKGRGMYLEILAKKVEGSYG